MITRTRYRLAQVWAALAVLGFLALLFIGMGVAGFLLLVASAVITVGTIAAVAILLDGPPPGGNEKRRWPWR